MSKIKPRTALFIVLGLLFIWLLYLDRNILTPFILAIILAYILNPLVNFLTSSFKLPRSLSILVIYFLIIGLLVSLGVVAASRISQEADEIQTFVSSFTANSEEKINTLPEIAQPIAENFVSSLQSTFLLTPAALLAIFPKAVSELLGLLIVLYSTFFLLLEGKNLIYRFLKSVSDSTRSDLENLLQKINHTLSGYLRGELFLIVFVSLMLFIALSILGIKFALILAIFSGLAEIIPFIGPLIATSAAVLVTLTTQQVNFSLDPLSASLIIILIYFFIRQFQDYLVTPYIIGRITKIHPFIVFFAVLSGGHLFGVLGYILAVPLAAIVKILLEYALEKSQNY